MSTDFSKEMNHDQHEKMKKNVVYISIFSIVMIFAGFTSAYIVSMGDTFWVKYPLPNGFILSTTAIALSSFCYLLANKALKNKRFSQLRIWMVLTLVCGIGFSYFQFIGYTGLVNEGAHFRTSIFVVDGRYGDYFEIKYKGKFIQVDGNEYTLNGEKLSEKQLTELKSFVKPFEKTANTAGYSVRPFPANFELIAQNEPVKVEGGKLIAGTKILQYTDMRRLKFLAWNIRDNRGDFYHKGKLGKDFNVFYKGKELSYKNRNLMFGSKILSAPLQLKASQSRDTSTSYLYIITVLHLLHVLAASIYLLRMVIISFKSDISEKNSLSIRLGSIFWHFLGILWLYLFLFLIYIH